MTNHDGSIPATEPHPIGSALAKCLAEIASRPAASSKTFEQIEEERAAAKARMAVSDAWVSVKASVGRRYANCTLESFVATEQSQRDALAALKAYSADIESRIRDGAGLVLIGPRGTGKDHLAIGCLFLAASKANAITKWIDGQSLFQAFRDNIDKESSERDAVAEFTRPTVLLISDPIPPLGEVTDFQRGVLWRILDRRYRDMRPTWVTMNVADSAEADKRLGPQLVDRLKDGALVVKCNWASYRKVAEQ